MLKKINTYILFVLLIATYTNNIAQVAINNWQDHLPYKNATNIVKVSEKVWCSTPYALFYYNTDDNSIDKLSKANGLSDFGISTINYYNDNLIVAYKNANIDIISKNSIKNIRDIKNSNIQGNKNIYQITCVNDIAYLACGFGIVLLDLKNNEIKETLYIGENASNIEVYSISFDNNYIYAATEKGIYYANKKGNLIDYSVWYKIDNIPNSNLKFEFIVNFNSNIFATYHNINENTSIIYKKEGNNWTVFYNSNEYIKKINVTDSYFSIIENNKISIYNINLNLKETITNFGYWNFNPNDCYIDENYNLFIGDTELGLVKKENGQSFQYFHPNGPFNNKVVDISEKDGKIWTVAGGRNSFWGNIYNHAQLNSFIEENWSSNILWSSPERDLVKIITNPYNNQVFAASWGGGVLEFSDNTLQKSYNATNSSLQSIIVNEPYVRIGGIVIDEAQNLWVTNSEVNNPISVKTIEGNWQSLNYPEISFEKAVGEIVVCSNNDKWVQLAHGGGLFIFNDNNTPTEDGDDEHKKISITDEDGVIISNNVYSIAVDKDDVVWVGTDKGVVTYFNSENVFSGTNFYADRIKIADEDYDNIVQYLLGNEKITAIEIDGANRKWFGTENSGVFLMSEDGQEQIFHFNTSNSPLISNNITSIKVNSKTGDVYFGTSQGLVSYKGTATKGDNEYKEAYIYPNPVKENFSGQITITGIADNANVKITNISGKLVYETNAFGGQALWNGKDFSGNKVHTGVYVVFCTDADGQYKKVLKLLVIN